MEEKRIVCFRLLGSFSYALTDGAQPPVAVCTVSEKVGKKTLSFLQYLIVNYARNISAEELIELFWTENGSRDPANALRNMLYKTRNLLKGIFPGYGELLRTLPGCYAWDTQVCIALDTDEFERLCMEARKYAGGESVELLRQAAFLYKGDFLSGNDSEWVRPLRQYYRALYLDACKTLLPLLEEEERWMEIVDICSQAFQIDFSVEEFTACQMRAFIAMGQPEQAVGQYESFKEKMLREFGMPPTERIEQLRALIYGLGNEDRGKEREIFRLLSEGHLEKHAFFCSFGVFQSIVALERRHLARSGLRSTLVIISLDNETVPSTDVRRLERILQEGLRIGDPMARLAAGSYIIMLTGTDSEDAQIVINRLDCTFHKTFRHSNARLTFRISVLSPEKEWGNL